MKSGLLANRARALKETTLGVKNVCRIMEEFAAEERLERDVETAARLIEMGKMTEEEVAVFFRFTPEQMAMVREEMAVLA